MIVSYVTTFCTVVGFIRTWLTTPRNVSFGKASTLNVTAFPSLMLPTSDSSVLVYTSIFFKSCAMVKTVAASLHAPTVFTIAQDLKDRWRLQRSGHRLSHVHIARHHGAIDRRSNHRIVEIRLGHCQSRGFLADLRLGLRDICGRCADRCVR